MSANKGQVPELTRFLGQLRGGLKDFGIRDIHDLLWGRQDTEFVKRAKSRLEQLNCVVAEIRGQCEELDHPVDGLHIKYVLWTELRRRFDRSKSKQEWDAEDIGSSILA